MLNKGKESADMTVTFEQMGLAPFTPITVYDLWKHSTIELPSKLPKITLPVASHGVAMFKVKVLKN